MTNRSSNERLGVQVDKTSIFFLPAASLNLPLPLKFLHANLKLFDSSSVHSRPLRFMLSSPLGSISPLNTYHPMHCAKRIPSSRSWNERWSVEPLSVFRGWCQYLQCLLLTRLAIAGSLPHLSILRGFRNQPYLIVLSDQRKQENKVRCAGPFRLHFVVKRGRVPLGPLTHFEILPNFCKNFYSSSQPSLLPLPSLSVPWLAWINASLLP